MEDNHAPTSYGNVDATSDALFRLSPQFPQLAIEVFDVRFADLVQTNDFNHLEQTQQPGPQLRRQGPDLSIYGVV